ncbi:MAG: D-3-phosphoglycerate dehydrogenase [Oscillospiraceae bacterium]|jgi:D-3-phosphoglycerate dehydrogenase / 2-oxoglutarate reductase
MKKKLLVTSRSFGEISDEPLKILTDAGYDVTLYRDHFNMDEFTEMIPDYDVLIIGGHKFPTEVMQKCSKLQMICKHGAGLDNIDLSKAKEMGIRVTNAPGVNSNAVADLTFGLMLSCARKISMAERDVRRGKWKTVIGHDVYAKTLGLMGFGAIAKNVARRAAGFSMKVLAYDPYVKELPEEFKGFVTLCADKNDVINNCDYLSMHLPLTDQTRNMIGLEQMDHMKKGAVIINTARGGIVNEDDLYKALVSGQISAAAMDVTEKEPMQPDHPLLSLEQVVVTPHIGMYSEEALNEVSLICAKNAVALLKHGALKFAVV